MTVKERIIQGGIELICTSGVRATTMDSVAQYLGISKRTIYENFSDKRSLVEAIVKNLLQEGKRKGEMIKSKGLDTIGELFESLKLMEEGFATHGKISNEVKRFYPEIYNDVYIKHVAETFELMVVALNDGIQQGLVKEDTNTRFVVFAIMETINALMNNYSKLNKIAGVTPVETINHIFIYFFRGIATPEGVLRIDDAIKGNTRVLI